MKRRNFLLSGAAFAAGAAPSDRIGLGVIGSGGRGTFVMGVFQKDPAVRVSAICDVYEPNLEKALSAASKAQGAAAKAYRNYAALLADPSVDAVLIATVIRPVAKMAKLADEISQGNLHVEELSVKGRDEISVLGLAFNRMQRSLARAMRMLEGEDENAPEA